MSDLSAVGLHTQHVVRPVAFLRGGRGRDAGTSAEREAKERECGEDEEVRDVREEPMEWWAASCRV